MKRTHFLAITALFLSACNTIEPPTPFKDATVDFDIYVSNQYPVRITCADHSHAGQSSSSAGIPTYSWNFGDGDTIVYEPPYDYNNISLNQVSHTYKKSGTYDITLTCVDRNGFKYQNTKTVSVGCDVYSHAQFIGFELYNMDVLPDDSSYIQFEITLYDLWGGQETYKSNVSPTKIYKYSHSYKCSLSQPVLIGEIPNPFDGYKNITAAAYCNDAQVCKINIDNPSELGNNTWVYTNSDTSELKMNLYFSYQ